MSEPTVGREEIRGPSSFLRKRTGGPYFLRNTWGPLTFLGINWGPFSQVWTQHDHSHRSTGPWYRIISPSRAVPLRRLRFLLRIRWRLRWSGQQRCRLDSSYRDPTQARWTWERSTDLRGSISSNTHRAPLMCLFLLAVQAKAASRWPLVSRKPSLLGCGRDGLVLSATSRASCWQLTRLMRTLQVVIAISLDADAWRLC